PGPFVTSWLLREPSLDRNGLLFAFLDRTLSGCEHLSDLFRPVLLFLVRCDVQLDRIEPYHFQGCPAVGAFDKISLVNVLIDLHFRVAFRTASSWHFLFPPDSSKVVAAHSQTTDLPMNCGSSHSRFRSPAHRMQLQDRSECKLKPQGFARLKSAKDQMGSSKPCPGFNVDEFCDFKAPGLPMIEEVRGILGLPAPRISTNGEPQVHGRGGTKTPAFESCQRLRIASPHR